jgi:hypothetical protein
LHAAGHKLTRQPRNFLKTKQSGMGQKGVVAAKMLLGHAVAAAKIAAVGDANAQIAQRPAALIQQASHTEGLFFCHCGS